MSRTIKTIDRRPTIDDPCGSYKLVIDGIYWGHWYVGVNWCGEKYVAEAASDGLPA